MNLTPKYLFILISLFTSTILMAQIEVSSQSGCPGETIDFNYNTSSSLTNIVWNFNDGGTGSNDLSSQHQYNNSSNYTVSFDADDNGTSIHETITITIHPEPTCGFTHSQPISGCVPLTVDFTDESTGGGGSAIVGQHWDFGDGGGVNDVANPSYDYTVAGAFTANLQIEDANGCISNCDFGLITVSHKPTPIINTDPNPPTACDPILNVHFDASSSYSIISSSPGLTYSWDFANGSTSTSVSSDQIYDDYGNYFVTLTVTDEYGCSHDTTKLVRINSPTAEFIVSDTVCHFVHFQNTSTPAGYLWDFGDGVTNSTNTHTYANIGHYTVTLIAYNAGCSDTVSHDIYVEEVFADFTMDPSFLCDVYAPGNTIQFTNQSSPNAVVFDWTLASPDSSLYSGIDTSSLENPVDTIIFIDTTYSYNTQRLFTICLLATSSHGCHDDTCMVDTIQKPNALFMPNIVDGCAPLTVEFSDSSIAHNDITEYSWDFGDGHTNTGTDTIIDHTYNTPGHYDVTISVTTENGCQDTSYAITIDVGNHTNPDFDITPTSICLGDSVYFTDLTPATDSVDTWHYIADDKHLSHCFINPDPTWKFSQEIGLSDISLITCNNSCCDTITKTDLLNVNGPLADAVKYYFGCENPYDYTFHGHVEDVESWTWDFGDGNTSSGLTDLADTIITHTYNTTGDYYVVLTANNSSTGCTSYSDTLIVHVREIKAAFHVQRGCDLDTITHYPYYDHQGPLNTFNASESQDVYENCNRGYCWIFGDGKRDGRTDDTLFYHDYDEVGTYNIALIVTDINGCKDTAYGETSVHDITAAFDIDTLTGCTPSYEVNVTDTSIYDFNYSSWYWDFGDGTTDTNEIVNHEYIYDDINVHRIFLKVTDSIGCWDTISIFTRFSVPDSVFTYASTNKICVGDNVAFNPPSNMGNYAWTFNDIDTTNITNTGIYYHTFPDSGYYQIGLTVTDTNGCVAKYTYPYNQVSVQEYPIAGFYSDPDYNDPICYGEQIVFYDTSIVSNLNNIVWDVGDGTPMIDSVIIKKNYNVKGIYQVSLIEITTNGCADTAIHNVEIIGPLAEFDFTPNDICKGESIDFSIFDMEDVYFLSFDYGDGLVDTMTVGGLTNVDLSHTYNYSPALGYTTAQLRIYSEEFRCSKSLDSVINIYPVIADFNINNPGFDVDTLHCLGQSDIFFNHSINDDIYLWNFGDGYTSIEENPNHLYNTAGTYDVVLSIHHNTTGCDDTLIKPMYIKPLPIINANGGDTCVGASIQVSAFSHDNIVQYNWSPNTGLNDANIANPVASPNESTTYIIIGIDEFGCTDTTTTFVYIQQEPSNWIIDTTIIIGEDIIMYGDDGGSFSYEWSPEDYLPCSDCPNPHIQPGDDIEYTLIVTDTMGCGFMSENMYNIKVLDLSSVDVPDIFTPNGDGDNDVIYVRGWGIKKLLEFSIYNRWGEKVFTTTDINVGWDGTYKGKRQNMDTYAYYVRVETYIDPQPLTKKGNITLIR